MNMPDRRVEVAELFLDMKRQLSEEILALPVNAGVNEINTMHLTIGKTKVERGFAAKYYDYTAQYKAVSKVILGSSPESLPRILNEVILAGRLYQQEGVIKLNPEVVKRIRDVVYTNTNIDSQKEECHGCKN